MSLDKAELEQLKSDQLLEKPLKGNTRNQYYVTFFANLLSMSYGATVGWASPSLRMLKSNETTLASGPLTTEGIFSNKILQFTL